MPNMDSSTPQKGTAVRQQMLEECHAMSKHALASGLEVQGSILRAIENAEQAWSGDADANDSPLAEGALEYLAVAHNHLAKLISPAKPRAITLLDREAAKGGITRFFGSVALVRHLMLVAIVFLVMLIGLGASKYTTIEPGEKNPWSIYSASGIEMLAKLMLLMSAAGIGACFAALFRANRFIVEGTYDPKYAMSYWIRLLTGVISGVVLCELIPVGEDPALQGVGKPTLALLGGFSGNTVYRILERLVQSIESVVRGDTRELADAQIREAESQSEKKAAEKQVALTGNLIALRRQLDTKDGSTAAKKELDHLLANLQADRESITPPA